jgi:GNAT superfamily N-acetyltransferase
MPEVLRMIRAFHAICPYADTIALVEADFTAFCDRLISGDDTALLVADGEGGLAGMVGAQSGPCFFNFSSLAAMEMFIWSEKPGIGTWLIKALEAWAQDINCARLAFVSQHKMKDAGPLYERLGYVANETSFLKVF